MKQTDSINNGVFDDPKLKGKPLKRFFRMLELDKKDIYRVYVFAIFSGIISLSLPLAIQGIISQMMGMQLSISIFVLIFIVSIAIFFSGALQIIQLKIIEDIQRRIFTRTSFEFAFKIPRFKIERVLSVYPPELINRFFDILTVEKGLPKIIIDLSTSIITIIFGLMLLSVYHPVFVFFGLLLLIFIYVLFKFTGKKGLETKMEQSSYKYAVAHWLQELGRSLITFKLMPYPNIAITNIDKKVSSYLDARKKHFNVLVTQYTAVIIFKTLIITGLLVLGALLVVNKELNLGQFVAVEIIIFIIVNAIEKLILTLEFVYDVLVGMEKISQVLSMPVEEGKDIDFNLPESDKGISIEVSQLSYAAFDNNHKALENINLEIKAGEKICIVGGNASGKSTLLHLLSGIYSDYTGSISYNDIPLQNFSPSDLTKQIACCFYNDDIFTGTITDNITMGQSGLLNSIVDIAEHLGLKEFIQSLPEGYETLLTPENRRYPKTFIQKIVLARNICKQPKLLILDNFLSQFEATEKEKIMNFLLSEKQRWSLVIISNEKQIAEKCERLIMLDKGAVVLDTSVLSALQDKRVKNILNS